MSDLTQWLSSLGLAGLEGVFRDNDLDLETIAELTERDLAELGLSLGHRKRLGRAVKALRGQGDGGPTADAQSPRQRFERRQVSVLFCDLVDSVVLSERLDPEDLSDVLRAYQETCREAIGRYYGYIAQFRGDGVLSYFGYPRAHEHDAERAVRAGLAVISRLPSLNARLHGLLAHPLQIRAAVATGIVVAGDVAGDDDEAQRLAVGEPPNLAARLQAFARPDTIVVAPSTRQLLKGIFEFEDLGARRLKGISEPVTPWQVKGTVPTVSRFAATHAARLTRLVGREEQMRCLLDYWRRAAAGRGRLVLLRGEPGVGKSRIVETLYEDLRGEEHLRLRYQCSPYYANSDLYPFIAQLELMSGFEAGDDAARKLEKLEHAMAQHGTLRAEQLDLIARLLSIAPDGAAGVSGMSPQQVKERTLAALADFLTALSEGQPLLGVLEDVHWVDPTTLELIDVLRDRLPASRILFVLTYREEFSAPFADAPGTSSIILTRLDSSQSEFVVRDVAGARALNESLVASIVEKADGIPLFLEELTALLLDSSETTPRGERGVSHGVLSPEMHIPATLHDSLMARLDRLRFGEPAAQLGAIIGREFSYPLVEALAPHDRDALREGLTELVAAGLLHQDGELEQATFQFKHALIQDVAYGTMIKRDRQRLHHRLADLLASRFRASFEARPEVIAHHYGLAGLPREAVTYWMDAGTRAAKRSANLEAAAHLQAALREFEAGEGNAWQGCDEQELEVCLALGPPLIATRGWAADEVEQTYLRARRLCERDGGARTFQVLRGLVNVYLLRGDLPAGIAAGERLADMAAQAGDDALHLEAYRVLGICRFLAGRFADADRFMERALDICGAEGYREHTYLYGVNPAVVASCWRAWGQWFLGQAGAATATMDQALALARGVDHPFSLGYALSFAATVAQSLGRAEEALEFAEETVTLAREHDHPYWWAWGTLVKGWAIAQGGGPRAGVSILREGLDRYERTGARQIRGYGLTLLAQACLRSGRYSDSVAAIDEALEIQERTGIRFFIAESHRLCGEVMQARRDGGGGARHLSCFERAASIAREQGAPVLELRAMVSLMRAEGATAGGPASRTVQRLACLCRHLDQSGHENELCEARALLESRPTA